MKKVCPLAVACFCLALAGGCLRVSREETEQVFAQTVALINEMCDVLEKSKDVQEAGPKLDDALRRLEKVRDEGKRVAVGASAMAAIQNKFRDQFQAAGQRWQCATQQMLARDRRGTVELQTLMGRFDKIMGTK